MVSLRASEATTFASPVPAQKSKSSASTHRTLHRYPPCTRPQTHTHLSELKRPSRPRPIPFHSSSKRPCTAKACYLLDQVTLNILGEGTEFRSELRKPSIPAVLHKQGGCRSLSKLWLMSMRQRGHRDFITDGSSSKFRMLRKL